MSAVRMSTYRFEAVVEVPDGTPFKDVEKWLTFELGAVHHLAGDNALAKHSLADLKVTEFWLRGPQ